ncbi:DUF1127 domain-containing protein [Thalassobaculum sp.]|jgi:uncharacterized protein YjiS (DUF1127 family)|uniref:DUF1127 domain-containing protein n=1 Tax=Thalassobaculum sp. TaxID=2022740 RepID=UPI0032EF20B4
MSTFDFAVERRGPANILTSLAVLPLRGLRAVQAWRLRREGIRLLLELDDRLLRDAGFTRFEIERLR